MTVEEISALSAMSTLANADKFLVRKESDGTTNSMEADIFLADVQSRADATLKKMYFYKGVL